MCTLTGISSATSRWPLDMAYFCPIPAFFRMTRPGSSFMLEQPLRSNHSRPGSPMLAKDISEKQIAPAPAPSHTPTNETPWRDEPFEGVAPAVVHFYFAADA